MHQRGFKPIYWRPLYRMVAVIKIGTKGTGTKKKKKREHVSRKKQDKLREDGRPCTYVINVAPKQARYTERERK